IDYLALVGDSVDNIPGVPKVGPKTAAKWLKEYGSLDQIILNADKIGGKVGESLRASINILPLGRKLVTLRSDLELGVAPEELTRTEPDYEALAGCFKRWEFNSWLAQLPGNPGNTDVTPAHKETGAYETILTRDALHTWLRQLEAAGLFAFDTETTSLKYMDAEIVGLSFATEPGKAAYIPVGHDYPGAPEQLPRDEVLGLFKPLLSSGTALKVGHNLKYDKNVLANYAIELDGIAHDSMLESYVLDSTASRHDMDSLALKYLDHKTIHYEDVAGKGTKQVSFNKVEIEPAARYAAEDADITLRLHQKLWPRLTSQPALKHLYEQTEIPLLGILSDMERTGVLI
ncbi:MAG: 5'-3' exonuclease H3TH domain-containing protein, partial [Pseudomonadales bacterium]